MKIEKVKEKYVDLDEVVVVTCPLHGDFTVVSGDHLGGVGCPDCLLEEMRDSAEHITEAMCDLQDMIEQIGCILATPKNRTVVKHGGYVLQSIDREVEKVQVEVSGVEENTTEVK